MGKIYRRIYIIVYPKKLKYRAGILAFALLLALLPPKLFAQAPAISYSGPQNYLAGTAIAALVPTSSGVAAPGFSSSPVTLGSGFSTPYGVAADAAGNIYVADSGNGVVKKIPVGGGSPVIIGSGFNFPISVAVDATGNVYVGDDGNNAVKEIHVGGGSPVTIGSGLSQPYGLAVDAAGNVFVTDYGNSLLQEIPAVPGGWGAPFTIGISGTAFLHPVGVAVDAAHTVYVSDSGNNQVRRIPAGSIYALFLGVTFNGPAGVAVDALGNIFVADELNNAVKEIPAGGSGSTITLGSGFSHPSGVAVDYSGKVYVADYLNNAIKQINPVGGYFISSALPPGLSFDPSTGIISGTPTTPGPAKNYTITAYNGNGGSSATVNIKVSALTISYSSPQTYLTGTAITALAPTSNGVATPGYNISSAPKGYGFNVPYGVAVDGAGNLYIADTQNHLVKELPIGGGVPVTIASGFIPTGVAVDAAGNVYVADNGNNVIKEILAGGGGTISLGSGFNHPLGVAVDVSGNIYVGDESNNAVKEIPAGGGAPLTLGTGFSLPTGVAVDASGNVYVADFGNNAVKEIPVGGGSPVTLGSGFSSPYGVAVDAAGNVFVADYNNNAVKEIIAGGGAPVSIGIGYAGAKFVNPIGVAVDNVGNVYVADYGSYTSIKEIMPVGGYYINPQLPAGLNFNNTTGIISGTPKLASPATNYTVTAYNSIAYNTPGSNTTTLNIKVNTPPPPNISYSSPQTYLAGIAINALAPTSSGVAPPGYSSSPVTVGPAITDPIGVAVDAAGNVYVSDAVNNVVKKIPAGGGIVVSLGSGFNQPGGLAVDGSGNVYVADYDNNAVKKIPVGGGVPVTLGSGFSLPNSVAIDAAGNVYVADGGNNAVKKIPVGGGIPVTIGSGFNAPWGVAVDAAGNVYVGDYGNNAVKEIPVGGGAAVTIGSGFNAPYGVAVDATNNLYVTDSGHSAVKEIPAGGGSPVTLYSAFSHPVGLAADGAGNVYVADNFNNAVKEIKLLGGYYINTPLPAGLSLNNTTGVISGTPTTVSKAANYAVTAYNTNGGSSAVINIAVLANTNLASLKLSSGTLTPVFAAGTTGYSANVANTVASITVTPTISDPKATITVNGVAASSGSASGSIALTVGANTIIAKVTAQDDVTTKTYTITVTRAPSANALLSAIKLTPASILTHTGTVGSIITYTTSVSNATSTVTVTATSADPTATIKVNGVAVSSGTASGSIALAAGPNTITTVVTAQNGTTTETYSIIVTRAKSNNAALANLAISSSTLSPMFVTGTYSYAASVSNATASVKVTPTTADVTASVTVNGAAVTSGAASGSIALVAGPNTITTVVTAQDGITTKTYTITVTRAPSTNALLSAIKLTPASILINTGTVGATTTYTTSVSNATASVTVTATTIDKTATIKVDGVTVSSGTASGSIALAVGSNTINTVVTAQDGISTRTYSIVVTRASGPVNNPDQAISVEQTPAISIENDGIMVHQAVSPNGDGINDFMMIDGIAAYPENKLTIINRNGALVYEAQGYDNTSKVFDGHSNKTGAMQVPGTYFYALDYRVNGVAKHKTGFIILKY